MTTQVLRRRSAANAGRCCISQRPSFQAVAHPRLGPSGRVCRTLAIVGIDLPIWRRRRYLFKTMRVLLTEDEPHIANVVARALVRDGHAVSIAGSIGEAREALRRGADLLILDLGLPDGSGLTLCRELRGQHSRIPILILTAQNQIELRVEGLDAGANDYLPKPFAIPELRARVRALGRRAPVTGSPVYTHDDLRIDFSGRTALKAGRQLPVTSREWAILEVLISRRGSPVTRVELLENVWGDGGSELASNSLDVLVARLRKKFGADLIQTLRHQGYCFVGHMSEEAAR